MKKTKYLLAIAVIIAVIFGGLVALNANSLGKDYGKKYEYRTDMGNGIENNIATDHVLKGYYPDSEDETDIWSFTDGSTLFGSNAEVYLIGKFVPELKSSVTAIIVDENDIARWAIFGGHDGYTDICKTVLGKKYIYKETPYGVIVDISSKKLDMSETIYPKATVNFYDKFTDEYKDMYVLTTDDENTVKVHSGFIRNLSETRGEIHLDYGTVNSGNSGLPLVNYWVDKNGENHFELCGWICSMRKAGRYGELGSSVAQYYHSYTMFDLVQSNIIVKK